MTQDKENGLNQLNKIYKNDTYAYSLNKIIDQHSKLCVEFFEIDNKIVLLFNQEHGCLSIFDAITGQKMHDTCNDDLFIYDYKLFDDREYLYFSSWFWSPIGVRTIYHVPTMLQTPDYKPTIISCMDCANAHDAPEITLFGCSTCKEFMEKKDGIFQEMSIRMKTDNFNKNRCEDILLRRFVEVKGLVEFSDNAKSVLENILADDRKKMCINTIGNISGESLSRYNYVLYQKINVQHENFNHVLAHTMFCGFVRSLPFPELNLTFKICSDVGDLNIIMTHTLLPCDYEHNIGVRHKIDMTVPIKITCSLEKN
jgi:hypothetical protein